MKIARFEHQHHIKYGLIQGEQVQALGGDPFGTLQPERSLKLSEVRLLPPCVPSKIICTGLNFHAHILDMKMPAPSEPLIFLKSPSALNGPGEAIVLPESSKQVEFEGELAVVIGKTCKNLSENEVRGAILGYSCFNDVTARDLQKKDGQFARAKSYDTFACLGPWIETELDPDRVRLTTRLNRQTRQEANTSDMIFKVEQLVAFASQVMTLYPGDVLSTGTPAGVGPMQSGDIVEVEIEGIGVLSNSVRA